MSEPAIRRVFCFLLQPSKRQICQPGVIEKVERAKCHDSDHKDNFY
jgi:hypothetical protein